jgi:hypothetical protein
MSVPLRSQVFMLRISPSFRLSNSSPVIADPRIAPSGGIELENMSYTYDNQQAVCLASQPLV